MIVADTLVATTITILQLLQHMLSLKLGAFVANCHIVPISKPRYSIFPTQIPRRVPIELDKKGDDKAAPDDEKGAPADESENGKNTYT